VRPGKLAIGIVVVIAGVGAAAVASIPAFLIGYAIADRWLQPHSPDWGEFPMALPFLAVLACILGLPGALSGWLGRGRRGWYAWVVTPVVSAAISGFSCAAVCLAARESLLDPVAFTIMFGLTITGFSSGLMSRVVAASLQWPARQDLADPGIQDGAPTSSQVYSEAMRRVSGPGFALLVLGALNVAVSLGFVWAFATKEAAIRDPAPLGLFAIYLALGLLMVAGGSKMRNLQGYRYALVAAIAAMVPMPFLFFGFPFGLWACVVLLDARVKAAFRR